MITKITSEKWDFALVNLSIYSHRQLMPTRKSTKAMEKIIHNSAFLVFDVYIYNNRNTHIQNSSFYIKL